jgi:hypothetical protein
MKTYVQIDLETLSLNPSNCVVMTAAAVAYNYEKRVFHCAKWALDVDEQMRKGRQIESAALVWWFQQSEEARKEQCAIAHGIGIDQFEDELYDFWSVITNEYGVEADDIYPMSNAASFDIAILDGMLENRPWLYRNVMCWRTLGTAYKEIVDWDLRLAYVTPHTAISDAKWQAYAHLDLMQKEPRVR